MNIHFKLDNLHVKMERNFALSEVPALEINIASYELKGNLTDLVKGFTEVLKLVQEQVAMEVDFDIPEAKPAPKNNGNGDDNDAFEWATRPIADGDGHAAP